LDANVGHGEIWEAAWDGRAQDLLERGSGMPWIAVGFMRVTFQIR